MSLDEINQTFEKYYPRIFAYFYKRLNSREDVEDLTSLTIGAFLDALQDETKQILKPEIYLWRIAHNQLAMWLRDKYKNPVSVLYDENWEFIDESLESHYSKTYQDRVEALMHCVDRHLDAGEKDIVHGSIILEQKSPILAEKLGLSQVNVRQKLSRSLKKLRQKCLDIWNHYEPKSQSI